MAVNRFYSLLVNKCMNSGLSTFAHRGLCFLCDTSLQAGDNLLCRACVLDLPFIDQACPLCALPGYTDTVCAECLGSSRRHIDQSVAVFRYAYPVNRLITRLKYHARIPLAGFLAQTLAAQARYRNMPRPDAFMAVPLHWSRLAERGFNQSLLIARNLSRITGVPVDTSACHRVRPTRRQSGLTAASRRRNLKNAFVVNGRFAGQTHVAIVDDVVTTGSTVNEMARMLAAAGVSRIDVWSCCRAL